MATAIPRVTLVLMGRTGNGKSATGNTILGKKVFESKKSSSGITKSSQLETCVKKDGQVVNVIDTPGMFNLAGGKEYIAKEIVKCINFASEGIHAVLLVFSLRTRFTKEEEATIQTLQNSFGPKIVDYAIVVLTGGDELDEDDDNNNGDSLEDYLSNECPVALKDILAACKNRCVVFDNKTKSELKKDEQVSNLLSLVTEMIAKNGGQPYKPGSISKHKLQKEFDEVKSNLEQSCTQDLYTDPMLEEKLNEIMPEINNKFQRQLKEEREARHKAEERELQIQRQYNKIEKKNEELRSTVHKEAKIYAIPHVTMVLMGRTGNGKSATGNTIIGKKVFESRKSLSTITQSSQLQTCKRKDGQIVNVIDTPGMFNLSGRKEDIAREIVKCINFASKGIHAVLIVFSLRTQFSKEDEATIQILQNLFGPKIVDYAIVVLTGGDEFDDDNDSNGDLLENYLCNECPVALKNILAACKNRCVVFDNKTNSELKKDKQVKELLDMVNEMIAKNGGQPYKPKLTLEKEFDEVKSKPEQSCTQDLYNGPKLEENLHELMPKMNNKFQRKSKEEREARGKVEGRSSQIPRQYRDDIVNQNEELPNAVRKKVSKWCSIL